jgi:hypothetical protein
VSGHKYNVGEFVDFNSRQIGMRASAERCEILRLLATDGDDPQYRVKCATESFERVVRESQLHPSPGQPRKAHA